jgi:hypothetical protein
MKKDKIALLEAELKKFKMLNEYSFYVPEAEEGDNPDGDISNLLLSEEDPEDPEEPDMNGLDDELSNNEPEGGEDEIDPEMEGGDEPLGNEPMETPSEEPVEDLPIEEPAEELPIEDEVELDVTELVNSTEEAKQSAEQANQKVDQLMNMVSKLESQISDINGISAKIDGLQADLEKRVPTPEEKIEMRSLDSYPYNLKLTDFWQTQEGKYDVLNTDKTQAKPNEYTLTSDDVDSDYSESNVRRSLDNSNPYEEEDTFF